MFLFPHVLQVVSAAESCHTTSGYLAADADVGHGLRVASICSHDAE